MCSDFGWLNDPVLLAVQGLIDAAGTGAEWTSSVAGVAANYSTESDVRLDVMYC